MTSRIVRTDTEQALLIEFIRKQTLPFSVVITSGQRRSIEQNKLQRAWINEIAEQLGDQTAEEVRAYCKLRIGVPILRAENEAFREKYDRLIKPMSYENKIECMMEPLDFPVTRIMTVKQKTQYLEEIVRHFAQQGVILSEAA